jgi:hypothetical protein
MGPGGYRPRATPTAAKVMLVFLIPFIAAIGYIAYLVLTAARE